jgi:hypothetical protein
VAFLAASFWFLLRRGPSVGPPAESTLTFKVETYSPGRVLQYADGQTPLRALRWLPPLPGSIQPVQILTQSNRQRLVLFLDGKVMASLAVPRPSGVREGFFNFAELRDAIIIPDDVAVLFYRSADPSTGEMPLIIAMDLASQAIRWVHRAPGERLALGGDSNNGSVFLFGTTSPVLRIPLALQKGERMNDTPFRASLKPMEMPEEIKAPVDLLPTGPWGFLLAHAGGLSSYSESKGWKHWPTPPGASLAFNDAQPRLAQSKGYWWQPFPGRILQIKADGSPVSAFDAVALAPAAPWSMDGALLKLRGADPNGNLWFSLAMPSTPSSVATPEQLPTEAKEDNPESSDTPKAWKPENQGSRASTSTPEDWNTYCSQGLERIYRWSPERRTLQGRALPEAWAALAPPPGLNRPDGLQGFRPESGMLLVESGPTAWFLPLEALPLGPPVQTGKGQPM